MRNTTATTLDTRCLLSGLQVCFIVGVLLSSGTSADELMLIRTTVLDKGVCGLTGTELHIGRTASQPVRAWCAIVKDHNGGPKQDLLYQRNRVQIRRSLRQVTDSRASDDDDLNEERSARIQQLNRFAPLYFDCVLLEFRKPADSADRFLWAVDSDMDGDISDETQQFVRGPHPDSDSPNMVIRIRASSRRPEFLPSVVALNRNENVHSREELSSSHRKVQSHKSTTSLPDMLLQRQQTLLKLDNIRTRKQHLEKVIAAADNLIDEIHNTGSASRYTDLLADTLYRKGRALGYMELPDVVAVKPVKDPAALHAAFEENFAQLDAIVDTSLPKFILLKIRRERRLGQRGRALQLVEAYHRTHPDPVWHFKKRFDLLNELDMSLQAHQVAAALWLNASKPDRPVLTVFRLAAETTHAAHNSVISGSWPTERPWCPGQLTFHPQNDGYPEAVAWLSDSSWSIDNMQIVSRQQQSFNVGTKQLLHTQVVTVRPVVATQTP